MKAYKIILLLSSLVHVTYSQRSTSPEVDYYQNVKLYYVNSNVPTATNSVEINISSFDLNNSAQAYPTQLVEIVRNLKYYNLSEQPTNVNYITMGDLPLSYHLFTLLRTPSAQNLFPLHIYVYDDRQFEPVIRNSWISTGLNIATENGLGCRVVTVNYRDRNEGGIMNNLGTSGSGAKTYAIMGLKGYRSNLNVDLQDLVINTIIFHESNSHSTGATHVITENTFQQVFQAIRQSTEQQRLAIRNLIPTAYRNNPRFTHLNTFMAAIGGLVGFPIPFHFNNSGEVVFTEYNPNEGIANTNFETLITQANVNAVVDKLKNRFPNYSNQFRVLGYGYPIALIYAQYFTEIERNRSLVLFTNTKAALDLYVNNIVLASRIPNLDKLNYHDFLTTFCTSDQLTTRLIVHHFSAVRNCTTRYPQAQIRSSSQSTRPIRCIDSLNAYIPVGPTECLEEEREIREAFSRKYLETLKNSLIQIENSYRASRGDRIVTSEELTRELNALYRAYYNIYQLDIRNLLAGLHNY